MGTLLSDELSGWGMLRTEPCPSQDSGPVSALPGFNRLRACEAQTRRISHSRRRRAGLAKVCDLARSKSLPPKTRLANPCNQGRSRNLPACGEQGVKFRAILSFDVPSNRRRKIREVSWHRWLQARSRANVFDNDCAASRVIAKRDGSPNRSPVSRFHTSRIARCNG